MVDRAVEYIVGQLRSNKESEWIADHISETIARDLTLSAREAADDSMFDDLDPFPTELSPTDQSKLARYETTRPLTDHEQVGVLIAALDAVFLQLPAIQEAAISQLSTFFPKLSAVRFEPPDEIDMGTKPHEFFAEESSDRRRDLSERLDRVKRVLTDGDTY